MSRLTALGAVLRCSSGACAAPTAHRWTGPLTTADDAVLARAQAPVLDVGCGPGRHVIGLARRGKPALGIDITRQAVEVARAGGASVLERSVFDRIPGTGRWRSALLLDGNIGIGADPVLLLDRVRTLLGPSGAILVEVDAPRTRPRARTVRLELGRRAGPWFQWAPVAADQLDRIALRSRLDVHDVWATEDRWFAELRLSGVAVDDPRGDQTPR